MKMTAPKGKEGSAVSAYSELIKNFEKIRAYMREFYLYGFKSREEYTKKSARSYDDERRRMESWLGEYMSFARTPEGKSVFISIDSRASSHNPFYKAWKAKSFTDGDITLHFILFDILSDPSVSRSLSEIMEALDERYLSFFETPMMFDESTIRKKLKEYTDEGIIVTERSGRRMLYRRAEHTPLADAADALDFFSEVSPCGAVGSFLLDKEPPHSSKFAFKHHYITGALDHGVLASLFSAMREGRAVTLLNHARGSAEPRENRVVPLRVFISAQSGRQHLLAYQPDFHAIRSFRIDYISKVKAEEVSQHFEELRARLDEMQGKMWGLSVGRLDGLKKETEHVEFTVRIEAGEEYILTRLEREKRVGRIERIDDKTYRFVADVYDTNELAPWIRSFICRIVDLRFSNRTVENRIRNDIREMYRMYGVEEEET